MARYLFFRCIWKQLKFHKLRYCACDPLISTCAEASERNLLYLANKYIHWLWKNVNVIIVFALLIIIGCLLLQPLVDDRAEIESALHQLIRGKFYRMIWLFT